MLATMRRTLLMFLTIMVLSGSCLYAQDRLPVIPAEKLTDAQKKAVADYKMIRGVDLAGPPWSVILRVPDLVVPSLQMRMHNINNSALSQKLTEFAILLAARRITNNFEWSIHAPAALAAGLSPSIIYAIADGRRPEQMAEDEEILYDFCTELLRNFSVSDPTYQRALAKFGEAGVVEATGLEGYYIYIAMFMNVARSPLAPGQKPGLPPFPAGQ
jgi:4-carboxymuconolactone decarboxylase